MTQLETIEALVANVQNHFRLADAASKKDLKHRIEAGRGLIQLKARIDAKEAGEIGWNEWCDKNIQRSRADIWKVMKLAGAEDPDAAHVEAKAKNALVNKEFRAREKQQRVAHVSNEGGRVTSYNPTDTGEARQHDLKVTAEGPVADRHDLVSAALLLVAQMSESERQSFFDQLDILYAPWKANDNGLGDYQHAPEDDQYAPEQSF